MKWGGLPPTTDHNEGIEKMKILKTLILACVLAVPAAAESSKDKAAITAAVFDYFHGQGEASRERLFRAFDADNATMVGVTRGEGGKDAVRSWKDMNEVLSSWAANENPAGGNRDGGIISMNMVDDRLAVVLFRSADRFYDALTLGKVNGQWKIIAKAFILQ